MELAPLPFGHAIGAQSASEGPLSAACPARLTLGEAYSVGIRDNGDIVAGRAVTVAPSGLNLGGCCGESGVSEHG